MFDFLILKFEYELRASIYWGASPTILSLQEHNLFRKGSSFEQLQQAIGRHQQAERVRNQGGRAEAIQQQRPAATLRR